MNRDNDFRIVWHHYEIRPIIQGNEKSDKDFEVVLWHEDFSSCFTICWLRWNPRESEYRLESCGMRLLEYFEDGLDVFIDSFVKWRCTLNLINKED